MAGPLPFTLRLTEPLGFRLTAPRSNKDPDGSKAPTAESQRQTQAAAIRLRFTVKWVTAFVVLMAAILVGIVVRFDRWPWITLIFAGGLVAAHAAALRQGSRVPEVNRWGVFQGVRRMSKLISSGLYALALSVLGSAIWDVVKGG